MAGSMNHALVPFHEVLNDSQAAAELEPYGIVDEQGVIKLSSLPPIPMDDPALLSACVPRPTGVSASWPLNKVVRIERRSIFSGVSISYRCVSSIKGRPRCDQLALKDLQSEDIATADFQNVDLDDINLVLEEVDEEDAFDEKTLADLEETAKIGSEEE
jgi:DNA-directed RNA polymerase subunit H (RpoH/RPB5)